MNSFAQMKKYTLLSVNMAAFLTPFMGSAVNLAIPAIGNEFNSSTVILSWVATSYLLASAAFLLPFGRAADILGRKKIFLIGLGMFFLSSLLCALSWSMKSLIVFRVLQGIGSSMIFGTGTAILTSVFPPQERGKALGINVATVYVGLSVGPVLGGILTHHLGWPSIFYLSALIALATGLITLKKLKTEWYGGRGETFDFPGTFLYMVGLAAFMFGGSSAATVPWAKYALIMGVVILTLFVFYEFRSKYPLLNISLFKNITFAFSNLAALINYSATSAIGFLLSIYLQTVRGFDSQIAGIILLFQPVVMAALSPFAGALSDRWEPRVLASWGMGLTTLGLVVFCFLTTQTPIWLIIFNLALVGIGFALFSSPNTNAVMSSVEKRFYGIASSTIGTMRLIGQASSMAVVTLIMALYVGNVKLTYANTGQFVHSARTAFIIFALVCFGGIFASLARGNISGRKKQKKLE